MTPQNFEMVAGDGKTLVVPVTDEGGAAVDLRAATDLRLIVGTPTPVEKTLAAGDVAVTGDDGATVEATLAPADTAARPGVWPIQLKVTLAGVPSTLLVGDLTAHPSL